MSLASITPNELLNALKREGVQIDRRTLERAIILANRPVLHPVVLPCPEQQVHPSEISETWQKLKDLDPHYTGSSLHVQEAQYLLNGIRYTVFWAIGSDDPLPFEITFKEQE